MVFASAVTRFNGGAKLKGQNRGRGRAGYLEFPSERGIRLAHISVHACRPACLSVCLFFSLSVYLPVGLLVVCLSVCLSVCAYGCVSTDTIFRYICKHYIYPFTQIQYICNLRSNLVGPFQPI